MLSFIPHPLSIFLLLSSLIPPFLFLSSEQDTQKVYGLSWARDCSTYPSRFFLRCLFSFTFSTSTRSPSVEQTDKAICPRDSAYSNLPLGRDSKIGKAARTWGETGGKRSGCVEIASSCHSNSRWFNLLGFFRTWSAERTRERFEWKLWWNKADTMLYSVGNEKEIGSGTSMFEVRLRRTTIRRTKGQGNERKRSEKEFVSENCCPEDWDLFTWIVVRIKRWNAVTLCSLAPRPTKGIRSLARRSEWNC